MNLTVARKLYFQVAFSLVGTACVAAIGVWAALSIAEKGTALHKVVTDDLPIVASLQLEIERITGLVYRLPPELDLDKQNQINKDIGQGFSVIQDSLSAYKTVAAPAVVEKLTEAEKTLPDMKEAVSKVYGFAQAFSPDQAVAVISADYSKSISSLNILIQDISNAVALDSAQTASALQSQRTLIFYFNDGFFWCYPAGWSYFWGCDGT